MIVDNIKNAKLYYGLSEKFEKALQCLANLNFDRLGPGKYEIDGDDMYVLIQHYDTKDISEGKFEAHRVYADIQYIHSGEEKLGWAYLDGQKVKTPFNSEKDIEFFEPACDFFMTLKPGMFCILLPQDLHMGQIKVTDSSPVKKALIKVKL